MEEIVTVDGKQFKLTYDTPLTADQKAQAIADIKKQSCGTCGSRAQPRYAGMATAGGRIGTLVNENVTCTKPNASSTIGDVVNLSARPTDGTAPYTVRFLGQFGAAPILLAAGVAPYGLTGANPQAGLLDGQTTTAVTYQISDAEIVASVGGAPAAVNVDGSGFGVPASAANNVRFLVHISDSCPTGVLNCLDYCDLPIVCVAPTCNFVVS